MFTDNSIHNLILTDASEREILSDVTYVRNFSENKRFLLYIKSGKAKLIMDKTLYRISSGCFVLCHNKKIKYRFSKRHKISVVMLSFSGDIAHFPCGVYKCADKTSVEKTLDLITEEFLLKKSHFEKMLSSLTENLFVTLSRAIEKETDTDKVVAALMLDIQKNYRTGKIDVNKYAEMLDLSKDRVSVIFKNRFGHAPYQYQIMLRMQDATDLLLHTDLSIGEIAEKLGYKNQLYFSTAYRKQMGVSPSEMRKSKKVQY